MTDIDLSGKTVLVTGANVGIGYETALALARLGARTGLVCRNRERGEHAQEEIRSLAGNPNVDLFVADLAARAEVAPRRAGQQCGRGPDGPRYLARWP